MGKKAEILIQAKEATKDKNRMSNILDRARAKLDQLTGDSKEFNEFISRIKLLLKMITKHLNGEYSSFSAKTILLITFAILYFVIPTDVLPDFIPILGFTDDISILYFIWRQVEADIDKFVDWEKTS